MLETVFLLGIHGGDDPRPCPGPSPCRFVCVMSQKTFGVLYLFLCIIQVTHAWGFNLKSTNATGNYGHFVSRNEISLDTRLGRTFISRRKVLTLNLHAGESGTLDPEITVEEFSGLPCPETKRCNGNFHNSHRESEAQLPQRHRAPWAAEAAEACDAAIHVAQSTDGSFKRYPSCTDCDSGETDSPDSSEGAFGLRGQSVDSNVPSTILDGGTQIDPVSIISNEEEGQETVDCPGDDDWTNDYALQEDSERLDGSSEGDIPLPIGGSQSGGPNLLSQRLFVKKLFKRIPQLGDTVSVLVKSKAHVKGKVGCRSELAMGNSNKVSTKATFEEPVYDGKPLYAGVYNGLSPVKHVKKRVFREIKVKIDWYAHSITHQIKNVVTFYRQLLRYIHPFQYQMLMTALYELRHKHHVKVPFEGLLAELNDVKKSIISRAKNFNSKLYSIKRCRPAFSMAKAFILELDEIYKEAEPLFALYRQFASHLRRLPVVSNCKPTVAIVGHVNVGKSWLFRKICTDQPHDFKQIEVAEESPSPFGLISDVLGLKWQPKGSTPITKPHFDIEIAETNFTTKSINLANIHFRSMNAVEEAQLLDTPGLLWRDRPNMNAYEKLTYAVLKDLPCGVIFCFDVTDSDKWDKQIKLYRMLESRFPHRPWINAVSKGEDENLLASEGIKTVSQEDLLDNLHSMLRHLDSIMKAQKSFGPDEDN